MDPAVKGIPLDSEDLIPVLTEIVVKHFHGTVNPEFAADQAAWEKACSRHAPSSSPRLPRFPCDLLRTTARSPVDHRTISAGARRAGRCGAEDRRVCRQGGHWQRAGAAVLVNPVLGARQRYPWSARNVATAGKASTHQDQTEGQCRGLEAREMTPPQESDRSRCVVVSCVRTLSACLVLYT